MSGADKQSADMARCEYMREYQNRWLKKRRLTWLKENGPCRQCGSSEQLEVDHIDQSQKVSHRVWSMSKEKQDAELKKCQALCHRCHARKSAIHYRAITTGKPGRSNKLTEVQVLEIFALKDCGETIRSVAMRFCIHHATVIKIWRGITWGWLTGPDSQLKLLAS